MVRWLTAKRRSILIEIKNILFQSEEWYFSLIGNRSYFLKTEKASRISRLIVCLITRGWVCDWQHGGDQKLSLKLIFHLLFVSHLLGKQQVWYLLMDFLVLFVAWLPADGSVTDSTEKINSSRQLMQLHRLPLMHSHYILICTRIPTN